MSGPKKPDTGRAGTILQPGGMAALREGTLTTSTCSVCEFDLTQVIREEGRCCVNCGAQIPGTETTVHVDLGALGPDAAPLAPPPPAVPRSAPNDSARAQNPVWVLSPSSRSETRIDLDRNGWGYYAAILFAALVAIAVLVAGAIIIREKMAAPPSDGGVSAPLDDVPVSVPVD